MPRGWVLLAPSQITLAYTHDDFGEHRALQPYGRRYGTACHRVAEPPADLVATGRAR